jgi:mannose-6-phosphate isomerase-like protein (cupin superfamily)
MKRKTLRLKQEFQVLFGNARAQAAEMTLKPGDNEGGPDNCHRGADQWLFVVSGSGVAIVEKKRHSLSAGTLLLIERGETHEIRNTGDEPLRTVNVYVPPAYTDDGEPLPAGRKQGS